MPKNIVICCDGTSNDVTGHSTNVLKLFRSLRRDEHQLTYYVPGVGTIADPSVKSKLGKWWNRQLNMGIGHGIREQACDAYRFLCQHYEEGDQIYLFGFSRGAYAARAAAGMIRFLGLMRPEMLGLEKHAWALYANDDAFQESREMFRAGNRFAKSFGRRARPKIHFLGVWDTVSSFGWLWNLQTLPHTAENSLIRHARHAVATDERRSMFKHNLLKPHPRIESFREIWLRGSHADVGGGWAEDVNGLSRLALTWMVDQAREQGLQINPSVLREFTWLARGSKKIRREKNESLTGMWWLIELLPRRTWHPRKRRMAWSLPNLGRRRRVPQNAIRMDLGEVPRDA